MFKQSKLLPPSVEGCVPRPRLLRCLEQGSAVMLLNAPAGYGKSSLAAMWLAQFRDGVWLSLEAGDSSGPMLWGKLITCLRMQKNSFGTTALSLIGERDWQPQAVVDSLIEDLSEWRRSSPQQFIPLVLDDLHLLEPGPNYAPLLRIFQCIPGLLQVLLTSRSSAFLENVEIMEPLLADLIDQHQLAFDRDETDALAAKQGLRLSEEVRNRLLVSTEGWITPMRMILRQMRNDGQVERWNDAWLAGHRVRLEPLISEHYTSQSSQQQQLLACLALVSQFDRALVRQLAPTPNLAETVFSDAFLMRLQQPGWFKIHDVYRGFLSKPFVGLPVEIQQQAANTVANWLAAQGAWLQALELLQQRGNSQQLTQFIYIHFRHWLRLGKQEVLQHGAHQLPESLIESEPEACLLYVWATADRLTWEQCAGLLQRVRERALEQGSEAELISDLHSAASYCALVKRQPEQARNEALLALKWSQQVRLPQRSRAQLTLGLLAYMGGNMGEASDALAKALVSSQEERHYYNVILALGYWVVALYQSGRFEEALQVNARTRDWLQEQCVEESVAAFWLDLPTIDILIARDELEVARQRLKPYLQFACHAQPGLRTTLIFYRAMQVHYSAGEQASTLEFLTRLEAIQQQLILEWTWGWPSVEAWHRRLTVEHAPEKVRTWYHQNPIDGEEVIGLQQMEERLLDATVLVTLGQIEQAAGIARGLAKIAKMNQQVIHYLQALVKRIGSSPKQANRWQ